MGPILVFGHSGQLAAELRSSLEVLAQVIAVDRTQCDLEHSDAISALIRRVQPQVIVNAAAYTAVDKAEQEAELARRINCDAPRVMAHCAAIAQIPLIHYSTDYVFSGQKAAAYVEDDPTEPLNVYGRTKRDGELAVIDSGAPHVIFRTSWVFGETGNNFVRTILRLAKERDTLRVVADQVGAPTSARLIADVTAHVIRSGISTGWDSICGIYHLTSSGATTWHAYACRIVELAHEYGMRLKLTPQSIAAVSTEEYPFVALRPKNSRMNCSKLERAFGLRMPGWDVALERMLIRIARS